MSPESSPDTQPTALRLRTSEVLLLVAVVVLCRVIALGAFPIYDDAFITYRYAVNLGEALGLVFNPGAAWEPVLGTTTPGYAVLLGGLHALGLDIVPASLAVNFACDAVSALLLIELLGRRAVAASVAVVAFACIPEIARISVGGMEPPMVVALGLAAVYLCRKQRPLASGACAALCCLFRPEAVLLVGVLLIWHLRARRDWVRFLAPVVIVGVLSTGLLTWIYGTPISQSVRAKAAQHGSGIHFDRIPPILRQSFAPSIYMAPGLAFVALGLVAAIRRRSAFLPFAVFTTSIVLAYTLAQPKTWGWYYYAPLATWAGLFGLGAEEFAGWVGVQRVGLSGSVRWLPLSLGALALGSVWTYSQLRPDLVTPRVYERLERWAAEESIGERDVTILASDIGAIGFFTGARILDTEGLVWPGAFDYDNPNEMARAHRPDYVMVVVNGVRLQPFLADTELSQQYEPQLRLNKIGANDLSPRLDGLGSYWVQDYLIFKRRTP